MAKVKPKDRKMISNSCSLSHMCELLFSHSCAIVEWVCVTNREAHSLYSSFRLDNYLPGPTSLRESNNPNAPKLWGVCPRSTRRVNLYEFTWLDYINYSPDRNIKVQWNAIHKIYKWNILKLQIHQHSLLTRKVFSWHSSSARVFITWSSSKLDHH